MYLILQLKHLYKIKQNKKISKAKQTFNLWLLLAKDSDINKLWTCPGIAFSMILREGWANWICSPFANIFYPLWGLLFKKKRKKLSVWKIKIRKERSQSLAIGKGKLKDFHSNWFLAPLNPHFRGSERIY